MGISGVRLTRSAIATTLSSTALRAFWRQTGLVLGVLTVVNGSNYLFHVVVSRLLGPSDYGALAALLAVLLVLSIPFAVIQTTVAERTAALRAADDSHGLETLPPRLLKTMGPFAWTAGVLVAVVGAPVLSAFLHVDLVASLMLAPYVVASVPASVAQGILQGQQRFVALAGFQLIATLLRLGFGVGFVSAGLGVTGALLGTVVAAALVVPLAFRLVRVKLATLTAARRGLDTLRGELRPALFGLTSFWLLAEADMALARHYLAPEASGYYSSAGLLSRALLFLPTAVGIVAFPRFVSSRGDPAARLRWLRASAAAVGVLAGVGFVGLFVLREPLVRIAFGDRFLPAADLLPILAVAMGWLAVVNMLVYFHIAAGSRAYVISLAGVAVEAVAIALVHETAEQVAVAVAVVSAVVAFFQYEAAASICRWRPRLQRPESEGEIRLWRPATVEVSVVLPCHNASSGLRTVVSRLVERLEQVESYEVIVVSDGSTDDTVEIARSLESSPVRVIEHPIREGKGHALQLGLSEARGEYIAFCDADGDISADEIEPFLTLMKLYEPDVVLGSKRHPLSEVYYPPLRRLLSWGYHKLTRVLFRVNVRDTQTGFKLIRRDVLASVLPRLLEKRYAFDLEFLVAARSLGYDRILEAPVRIQYRFASQVNPAATFGILLDTLAVFYRHYVLNSYRRGDVPIYPGTSDSAVAPSERRHRERGRRRDQHQRVLFLNWRDIQNPEAGGAEIFAHEVAKRWVEQGHDVTLLASGFPGGAGATEIDGVRVRRLGRLRTGTFHGLVQRELMRLEGFDLIVEGINTIPFLTPLYRYRLPPVVPVIHQLALDVWDAELPKPAARAGRALERALLGLYREATVVTISDSTRADLERLGFTDVTVVPPGRDEPPELGEVAKEPIPTFLFVGRLAANKRPAHAVEAFQNVRQALPDARLWIVGQGPEEQALAQTLPEGATMLGRLSRAGLYERMARAHCLLFPSVREGWGLVVIEANSVGTPAVGYDVPGIRDSIRDGETGLLAEAGVPTALAAKATRLVADPARYEAMRQGAIRWAGRFSWDLTASELLAVVQPAEAASSAASEQPLAAASLGAQWP